MDDGGIRKILFGTSTVLGWRARTSGGGITGSSEPSGAVCSLYGLGTPTPSEHPEDKQVTLSAERQLSGTNSSASSASASALVLWIGPARARRRVNRVQAKRERASVDDVSVDPCGHVHEAVWADVTLVALEDRNTLTGDEGQDLVNVLVNLFADLAPGRNIIATTWALPRSRAAGRRFLACCLDDVDVERHVRLLFRVRRTHTEHRAPLAGWRVPSGPQIEVHPGRCVRAGSGHSVGSRRRRPIRRRCEATSR